MALKDATNNGVAGHPPGSAAKMKELQSRCATTSVSIIPFPIVHSSNGRTTDPTTTVCLDRAQDGSNATDEHERWTDEREESVGTVERETVESTERVRCV